MCVVRNNKNINYPIDTNKYKCNNIFINNRRSVNLSLIPPITK